MSMLTCHYQIHRVIFDRVIFDLTGLLGESNQSIGTIYTFLTPLDVEWNDHVLEELTKNDLGLLSWPS